MLGLNNPIIARSTKNHIKIMSNLIDVSTKAKDRDEQPAVAQDFNGTDQYNDLGSDPIIPATNDFTLCGWANLDSVASHSTCFSQYVNVTGDGGVLVRFHTTDKLSVFLESNGSHSDKTLSSTYETTGTYVFWALRRNGATFDWFVNGVLVDTTTDSDATRSISTSGVVFGARSATGSIYNANLSDRFNGKQATIQFFDSAINIEALYQQGQNPEIIYPNQPIPTHCWYLNGNGFDSANKRHATIINESTNTWHEDKDTPYQPFNLVGYDQARYFDGSNFLDGGNVDFPNLNDGDNVFEFEFLRTSTSGICTIVCKGAIRPWVWRTNSANFQFRYRNSSDVASVAQVLTISANTFYKLKCVVNPTNGTIRVYDEDDVLLNELTGLDIDNTGVSGANPHNIGAYSNGNDEFEGYLGRIKWEGVFDYDLSSETLPTGFSESGSPTLAKIPLDPSNKSIIGRETPTYTGRVPRDFKAVNSPCLTFNGTDQYIDTERSIFGGRTDVSVVVDFKSSSSDPDIILSEYDTGGNNRSTLMSIENDQLRVLLSDDGINARKHYRTTGLSLNDGNTHRVGFVFSGGVLTLFVDGAFILDGDLTKTVDSTCNQIYDGDANYLIGAFSSSSSVAAWHEGSLWDCRVHGAALSLDQINDRVSDDLISHVPFSNKGMSSVRDTVNKTFYPITNYAASMWNGDQDDDHEHLNNGCDIALDLTQGNHYVTISNNDLRFIHETLTFEIELDVYIFDFSQAQFLIGNAYSTSSNGFYLRCDSGGGHLRFLAYQSVPGTPLIQVRTSNGLSTGLNKIKVVGDGSSIAMEVNGVDQTVVIETALAASFPTGASQQPARIGRAASVYGNFLAARALVKDDSGDEVANYRCVDGANGQKAVRFDTAYLTFGSAVTMQSVMELECDLIWEGGNDALWAATASSRIQITSGGTEIYLGGSSNTAPISPALPQDELFNLKIYRDSDNLVTVYVNDVSVGTLTYSGIFDIAEFGHYSGGAGPLNGYVKYIRIKMGTGSTNDVELDFQGDFTTELINRADNSDNATITNGTVVKLVTDESGNHGIILGATYVEIPINNDGTSPLGRSTISNPKGGINTHTTQLIRQEVKSSDLRNFDTGDFETGYNFNGDIGDFKIKTETLTKKSNIYLES